MKTRTGDCIAYSTSLTRGRPSPASGVTPAHRLDITTLAHLKVAAYCPPWSRSNTKNTFYSSSLLHILSILSLLLLKHNLKQINGIAYVCVPYKKVIRVPRHCQGLQQKNVSQGLQQKKHIYVNIVLLILQKIL